MGTMEKRELGDNERGRRHWDRQVGRAAGCSIPGSAAMQTYTQTAWKVCVVI
jgi:hypothetical protein